MDLRRRAGTAVKLDVLLDRGLADDRALGEIDVIAAMAAVIGQVADVEDEPVWSDVDAIAVGEQRRLHLPGVDAGAVAGALVNEGDAVVAAITKTITKKS